MMVCLGWDPSGGVDYDHSFDLDVCAYLLNQDNRARNDDDFIYYNYLQSRDKSVTHHGDNLTGIGDETDDEKIEVSLEKLPPRIEKVAFSVTIHQADERQQHFGIVKSAYIRLVDLESKTELTRFNLTENAAGNTGFVFCEIFRFGEDWKFRPIEAATTGGIFKIVKDFDVNIAPASLRDKVRVRALQD